MDRDRAPADHGSGERDGEPTVVRTFLIVDVRGYTSFTQTHGDEEAGRLAARFAGLARETVTVTGGEVVELRGDEALCVYPSARQALRAAVELQSRFRARLDGEPAFPLGIGVGVAAGEAVPVEGGYRGGALNLAARLCGLAAPGQIVASETVTALAGRLDSVRFVERRAVRVKGFDRPVRTVEVVPAVPLPPVPSAAAPRPRRRGLLVAAAVAAVALAAAIAAAVVMLSRDSDESGAIGNAIASVGKGGDPVYAPVANTPSTVAVGEGAVWVLNADDRTISKLDPDTRTVVKTFGTGGTTTDLAVGAGAVWVGNGAETPGEDLGNVYTGSVSRLDPDSTDVIETTQLPGGAGSPSFANAGGYRVPGVSQVAAGAGAVWAINPNFTISRLDRRTGRLVAVVQARAGSGIAAGREGVWAISADESELLRIDRRTNKVAQRISVATEGLQGLAVGGGSVWATDLGSGLLWRVEPGRPPTMRSIDVGFGVTAVAYGDGAAWVTNFVRDELVRIDARTNQVTARMPLSGTPASVANGHGEAWVSIAGAPRGDVLPGSACGRVVSGGRKPDVLIASDFPLKGPAGDATRVLADAARFVVRRHRFRAGKYRVGYQSCDNSTAQSGAFDVLKCASNAKAFAATARLVGVVGPWNSQCAAAQIPIANRAEGPLALISPSNTHEGLTHAAPGAGSGEPGIYYPTGVRNYVRVTAPGDFEAAAGAVLARQLGIRRVYTLASTDDGPGTGYIAVFTRTARKLGITVVGSARWQHEAKSYRALASRVAKARPDGVFIADQLFSGGGRVVEALRAQLGRDLVVMATEAVMPIPQVLEVAGRSAVGMYVTTTALTREGLGPAGVRFLREFAATQPGRAVPIGLYVPETAQATEALLEAIARSDGTRASVLRELRRLKVTNGILGRFRFNRNGDMIPPALTVVRITGERGGGGPGFDPFAGGVVDRVVRVPPALVSSG